MLGELLESSEAGGQLEHSLVLASGSETAQASRARKDHGML
jgi:hypothetical protein